MEVVIFCGLQASGKSSFYRSRFAATHEHINLDTLRTRHRERTLYEQCLSERRSVVVDNTNPTADDRARYLQPLTDLRLSAVGYFFRSSISECLARNAGREGGARLPDVALLATHRKLEIPTLEEGFERLNYVRLTGTGFEVEVWRT